MDCTLRDYLRLADEAHDYIDKYCLALHPEQIEEKINKLQAAIKTIQSVAKRIADISNIATRVLNRKDKRDGRTVVDPYPTGNDHAVLRTLYPEQSMVVGTDISIPVRVVEKVADIPISYVYYISELKQYAINVAGVVIKGSLGNITEYQEKNSARCDYGAECKSFSKGMECPYYHDPEDFLKHGMGVPDKPRNFTAGSWIYSRNKNPKTYFARHVGSLDRLEYDLTTLKKMQYREEISNREGQLVHDLLCYMILNSKGLLERYPHWSID